MPRPSRKDEILLAALACFARQGVDGTRVSHIAREAGLSDAALYRHFPSLDALTSELFRECVARFTQLLGAAIADAAPAPRDQLAAVLTATLDARRDEPDAFVFVLDEQPRRMHELPRDFPYPVHAIERLIRDGQADHSVRDGDPGLLAAMWLGVILRPTIVARSRAAARPLDLDSPAARATILTGAWNTIAASPV